MLIFLGACAVVSSAYFVWQLCQMAGRCDEYIDEVAEDE